MQWAARIQYLRAKQKLVSKLLYWWLEVRAAIKKGVWYYLNREPMSVNKNPMSYGRGPNQGLFRTSARTKNLCLYQRANQNSLRTRTQTCVGPVRNSCANQSPLPRPDKTSVNSVRRRSPIYCFIHALWIYRWGVSKSSSASFALVPQRNE